MTAPPPPTAMHGVVPAVQVFQRMLQGGLEEFLEWRLLQQTPSCEAPLSAQKPALDLLLPLQMDCIRAQKPRQT